MWGRRSVLAVGVWALATSAVLLDGGVAAAQVGERGRITTRSDVKMSIEGVPGTSGKKLEAFAKVLGAPLGTIKRCYGELVKEHPEVVGALLVELELKAAGKLLVRAPAAVRELKPMQGCLDRAFQKLDVSAVPRPAGVRVQLELGNSAAASVAEVRQREQSAAEVAIEEATDGSFRSRGGSTQGEVTFEVSSRTRPAVERVHTAIRDALPGLFDCRRRAGKKGSPAGQLSLVLSARGALSVGASSVENPRAPACVSAVLKRALQQTKTAAHVETHFAP